MSNIPSPRQNVSVTDPQTGDTQFTRPWFLFFQYLYAKVGGSLTITTNDLAQDNGNGVAELQSVMQVFDHSESLRTELNGLREQVAELRKDIQSIRQGTIL